MTIHKLLIYLFIYLPFMSSLFIPSRFFTDLCIYLFAYVSIYLNRLPMFVYLFFRYFLFADLFHCLCIVSLITMFIESMKIFRELFEIYSWKLFIISYIYIYIYHDSYIVYIRICIYTVELLLYESSNVVAKLILIKNY